MLRHKRLIAVAYNARHMLFSCLSQNFIATIFIPLVFVAGLYGMNFGTNKSTWNMLELEWVYGYPTALCLMLVMASGMLWYFHRKGRIIPFGR